MGKDFRKVIEQLQAMQGFERPWFVCGGWALDMFLGRQTRHHHDLDIGLFRQDQLHLQEFFAGGELYWLDNGTKRIWEKNQYLELPVHEIWMEKEGLRLEFVLNERITTKWVYRRNPIITLPLDELMYRSTEGIPYLTPEVILLYKSNNPTGKNQQDFLTAQPHLNEVPLKWLYEGLRIIDATHPWLPK